MLKNKINYLLIGLFLTSSFIGAAEQPVKIKVNDILEGKYFKKELDYIKNNNDALYQDIITKVLALYQSPRGSVSSEQVKKIIQNALLQLKSGMIQQPVLGQNRMTMREFATINVTSLSTLSAENPALYTQVKQTIKATTDAQGKIDATAAHKILQDALQKLSTSSVQMPVQTPSETSTSTSTVTSTSMPSQPEAPEIIHLDAIIENQMSLESLFPQEMLFFKQYSRGYEEKEKYEAIKDTIINNIKNHRA
jgi:hypothetical protein